MRAARITRHGRSSRRFEAERPILASVLGWNPHCRSANSMICHAANATL